MDVPHLGHCHLLAMALSGGDAASLRSMIKCRKVYWSATPATEGYETALFRVVAHVTARMASPGEQTLQKVLHYLGCNDRGKRR